MHCTLKDFGHVDQVHIFSKAVAKLNDSLNVHQVNQANDLDKVGTRYSSELWSVGVSGQLFFIGFINFRAAWLILINQINVFNRYYIVVQILVIYIGICFASSYNVFRADDLSFGNVFRERRDWTNSSDFMTIISNKDFTRYGALPAGYSGIFVDRESETRGGGLAVLFRDTIKVTNKTANYVIPASCELLVVNVYDGSDAVTLVNIYRPPSSSLALFLKELTDLIQELLLSGDRWIIGGDLKLTVQGRHQKRLIRDWEIFWICLI